MRWCFLFLFLLSWNYGITYSISIDEQLSLDLNGIPIVNYSYLVLLANNPSTEIDGKIYGDFKKRCLKHINIACILSDVKSKSEFNSEKNFYKIYFPEEPLNLKLPYIVMTDNSKKVIFYAENIKFISDYLDTIFSFVEGRIDKGKFEKKITDIQFRDEMTHIVPMINFVIMLHKKGEKQRKIDILKDFANYVKTEKGKIAVAEIYLRTEYPEGVIDVLDNLKSDDAYFYRGISYYLLKEYKKAIDNLLILYDKQEYKEKVKTYIIKSYEALGENEKIKYLN